MHKRTFVATLVVISPLSVGQWLQHYIAGLAKAAADQM